MFFFFNGGCGGDRRSGGRVESSVNCINALQSHLLLQTYLCLLPFFTCHAFIAS